VGLVYLPIIFRGRFKSGINTATYKYYIDFASSNNIDIYKVGRSTTEILITTRRIMRVSLELIRTGKERGWILNLLDPKWKPLDANLYPILETVARERTERYYKFDLPTSAVTIMW